MPGSKYNDCGEDVRYGLSCSVSWTRGRWVWLGVDTMPLASTRDLTDAQWEILDDLIPEPTPRKDGRGRPWKDRRDVLNGILWVLQTGAP